MRDTLARTARPLARPLGGLLARCGVSTSGMGGFTRYRTNLCLQSETFDNAAWTKGDVTVTADNTAAPPFDGKTTADRIVEAATTAEHTIYQAIAGITTCTYSVFLKAGERTFASLRFYNGPGAYLTVTFNLSTGAVTQTSNAGGIFSAAISGSVAQGNGWYRCWVKATRTSGSTTFTVDVGTTGTPTPGGGGCEEYAGNASNGIYAWGAQVEVGGEPTRYIPTVAAAVTDT